MKCQNSRNFSVSPGLSAVIWTVLKHLIYCLNNASPYEEIKLLISSESELLIKQLIIRTCSFFTSTFTMTTTILEFNIKVENQYYFPCFSALQHITQQHFIRFCNLTSTKKNLRLMFCNITSLPSAETPFNNNKCN